MVSETEALVLEDVHFNEQGLAPCIVEDADTLNVLMMAWMNRESLQMTVEQRTTWFWSRSRQKLWRKGEESGNTQQLVSLYYDCDADTLLALVHPKGPACHTGNYSCFYRTFDLPDTGEDSEFGAMVGDSILHNKGLKRKLGIRVVEESHEHVAMRMPIVPSVLQPAGFLHGGATLTLLESCCSWASTLGIDPERELSFGSHIDIKHIRAAKEGYLHGSATLDHVDNLGDRGRKEYWNAAAVDDAGHVISTGTITTRVVDKGYFESRQTK